MILHILPGDLSNHLLELLLNPDYAQKMLEEAPDLAAMKTLILHCLPRDFRARVITAITVAAQPLRTVGNCCEMACLEVNDLILRITRALTLTTLRGKRGKSQQWPV